MITITRQIMMRGGRAGRPECALAGRSAGLLRRGIPRLIIMIAIDASPAIMLAMTPPAPLTPAPTVPIITAIATWRSRC